MEVIREGSQFLLASDAHESDDSIHPNNSFSVIPFRPEVERYGGPHLLPRSLEVFMVSSLVSLGLLLRHAGRSRGAQLAAMLRLLLHQALCFAADEDELAVLLEYANATWGDSHREIVDRGRALMQEQRDTFLAFFEAEFRAASAAVNGAVHSAHGSQLLGLASRRLSWELQGQNQQLRRSIGASQLHMTANRLGLDNVEEVYLGSALTCLVEEVCSHRQRRSKLVDLLACSRHAQRDKMHVQDLLPVTCAEFLQRVEEVRCHTSMLC